MRGLGSGMEWTKKSAVLGVAVVLAMAGCAKNEIPQSPVSSNEVENVMEHAGDVAKDIGVAATITPKVKTALVANSSLKGTKIDVSTVDKTVTLSGTVTNNAQKNLAGNIAKQQASGFQIVNKLQVKGGASPIMNKKKAG